MQSSPVGDLLLAVRIITHIVAWLIGSALMLKYTIG
ncbi:hypothetical protein SOVF_124100 isoform B [Spinacia oleracea]|nr:hypothetical protein SOVF_124100 isoform B [Spinacia oleracea]